MTEVDYETALERKEVFREFLERKVFVEGTIMVVSNCGPDIGFRDVKTPYVILTLPISCGENC